MNTKRALFLLAGGFEETEAVATVDVLRRGGVEVVVASTTDAPRVAGAHGIDLTADVVFHPGMGENFDLIAFPGGMGCMQALRKDERVLAELRAAVAAGHLVGAICASPAVLFAAGLLEGRRFCCYPGIEKSIAAGTYDPQAVTVKDGPVITGTGPGTATAFGLALLETLMGKSVRNAIAAGMLLA